MAREKFDPFTAFDNFDKFVENLQKLREGYDLLHTVYLHESDKMSQENRRKLQDYFGFDDSE